MTDGGAGEWVGIDRASEMGRWWRAARTELLGHLLLLWRAREFWNWQAGKRAEAARPLKTRRARVRLCELEIAHNSEAVRPRVPHTHLDLQGWSGGGSSPCVDSIPKNRAPTNNALPGSSARSSGPDYVTQPSLDGRRSSCKRDQSSNPAGAQRLSVPTSSTEYGRGEKNRYQLAIGRGVTLLD